MDPLNHNWQDWKKNLNSLFGDQFLENFDGIFKQSQFPPINMYKNENECLILASIPGLDDVNSVDVFVDYQSIELKGNINLKYRGFQLIQNELFNGFFERQIDLPFPVKDDKIDASFHNGLLILHLHRLISQDGRKSKVSIRKLDH